MGSAYGVRSFIIIFHPKSWVRSFVIASQAIPVSLYLITQRIPHRRIAWKAQPRVHHHRNGVRSFIDSSNGGTADKRIQGIGGGRNLQTGQRLQAQEVLIARDKPRHVRSHCGMDELVIVGVSAVGNCGDAGGYINPHRGGFQVVKNALALIHAEIAIKLRFP